MPDPRKTWRTVGYWGLTLNITAGPVLLLVYPEATLFSQVYPMLLAAWTAAAAVRQWGKSKGKEL